MRAIFSCECVRKTLGRAVPVVYRQSDMSRHVSGGPIGKERGDRKKGRSARSPRDVELKTSHLKFNADPQTHCSAAAELAKRSAAAIAKARQLGA